MSKTTDRIINTSSAGTPVIDVTDLGNHISCHNCISKDQQIADLEAKLAESELKHNATNRAYWELVEKQDNDFLQYEKLIGENQQIKQQLEDLENDHNKLIEQYDNQYNDLCKEIKVHSSARERFVKKVEELKQQLAEKEKSALYWKQMFDNSQKALAERMERVNEVLMELAEKDEEIEALKQRLKDTIKIYSDDFVEKDKELKELRFQARNIFPLVENLEDKVNKDKISFAVEQLEKVKEYNAGIIYGSSLVDKFIDNQINELKEIK